MNLNHYTIAALPRLAWDSELPCTFEEFIQQYYFEFKLLEEGIDKILLLNDIKNLELILKFRTVLKGDFEGNRAGEQDLFKARVISPQEQELFLEDPFVYKPEAYPEFMVEFFLEYKDDMERLEKFEQLYIGYFRYLQEDKKGFFRFYGRIATTMRTVLCALRLMKQGKELEGNLVGDPFIVQQIIEHRTTSDLGLKTIFPEIPLMIALFEKEPLDLEHELDRIRFKLMEDVGQESPFGDHIIYSYLIAFFLRDRWNTLKKDVGEDILDKIIQA